MIRPRLPIHRESAASDGVAGLVLGVESVPDGLALGLMAGVNPVYGLYAYLVGTFTGALATSSSFMAVQATGAMAIIIADVDAIRDASDPARALFTLSFMTGVLMIVAGVLRLGSVLRFVSNAVMVGFVNAVGVNIMLGQLGNFTGYDSRRRECCRNERTASNGTRTGVPPDLPQAARWSSFLGALLTPLSRKSVEKPRAACHQCVSRTNSLNRSGAERRIRAKAAVNSDVGTPKTGPEAAVALLLDREQVERLMGLAFKRFGIRRDEAEELLAETLLVLSGSGAAIKNHKGFAFHVFYIRCCRWLEQKAAPRRTGGPRPRRRQAERPRGRRGGMVRRAQAGVRPALAGLPAASRGLLLRGPHAEGSGRGDRPLVEAGLEAAGRLPEEAEAMSRSLSPAHLDEATLLRLVLADLDAAEHAAAERHLRRCAACRREISRTERLDASIRESAAKAAWPVESLGVLPSDDPFSRRPEASHRLAKDAGLDVGSLAAEAAEASIAATARTSALLEAAKSGKAPVDSALASFGFDSLADRLTLSGALSAAFDRVEDDPAACRRFAEAALDRISKEPAVEGLNEMRPKPEEYTAPLSRLAAEAQLLLAACEVLHAEFDAARARLDAAWRSLDGGKDVLPLVARMETIASILRTITGRPAEGLALADRAAETFAVTGHPVDARAGGVFEGARCARGRRHARRKRLR